MCKNNLLFIFHRSTFILIEYHENIYFKKFKDQWRKTNKNKKTTDRLFNGIVNKLTTFCCFNVSHHPHWYRPDWFFIWNKLCVTWSFDQVNVYTEIECFLKPACTMDKSKIFAYLCCLRGHGGKRITIWPNRCHSFFTVQNRLARFPLDWNKLDVLNMFRVTNFRVLILKSVTTIAEGQE